MDDVSRYCADGHVRDYINDGLVYATAEWLYRIVDVPP
jgi:hypothetical protein